jgi:hypothetical protein
MLLKQRSLPLLRNFRRSIVSQGTVCGGDYGENYYMSYSDVNANWDKILSEEVFAVVNWDLSREQMGNASESVSHVEPIK